MPPARNDSAKPQRPGNPACLVKLREILKPGDTVRCIQRHTSRSGASRSVSLYVTLEGDLVELDELVAPALGLQLDAKHGGIRVYATEEGVTVDAAATLLSALSNALGFTLAYRWL